MRNKILCSFTESLHSHAYGIIYSCFGTLACGGIIMQIFTAIDYLSSCIHPPLLECVYAYNNKSNGRKVVQVRLLLSTEIYIESKIYLSVTNMRT